MMVDEHSSSEDSLCGRFGRAGLRTRSTSENSLLAYPEIENGAHSRFYTFLVSELAMQALLESLAVLQFAYPVGIHFAFSQA